MKRKSSPVELESFLIGAIYDILLLVLSVDICDFTGCKYNSESHYLYSHIRVYTRAIATRKV